MIRKKSNIFFSCFLRIESTTERANEGGFWRLGKTCLCYQVFIIFLESHGSEERDNERKRGFDFSSDPANVFLKKPWIL